MNDERKAPIPGPQPIYGDLQGSMPVFVGRQAELLRLKHLWDSHSEESSVVKVTNMPSIGKTSLARQLFRTFGRAKGTLCIEVNCKDFLAALSESNPVQGARRSFDTDAEYMRRRKRLFHFLPQTFLRRVSLVPS